MDDGSLKAGMGRWNLQLLRMSHFHPINYFWPKLQLLFSNLDPNNCY